MVETKGMLALRERMAERGLSQQAIAEKLGVSQPSVSAWLKGSCRPDSAQRDALELSLAIPRELWRTDEEQTRLDALSVVTEPAATGTDGR